MRTIYDLFLNFQEVAFEFFEWAKQDSLEHIKKIPMVHVSSDMVVDLLNQDVQVSCDFLGKIENLTEKFDMTKIPYVCLFTDGRVAVAVEFNENGYSMYKSRLILEDEEEVVSYARGEEEQQIDYRVLSEYQTDTYFTRKERRVRNYLEKEISSIFQRHEHAKLQYLYLEYFDVIESDMLLMKDRLLDSMKNSLNSKHFDLYELLLSFSKKKKVS